MLVAEDRMVDLHRFRSLVARAHGDDAHIAGVLTEALLLRRGDR